MSRAAAAQNAASAAIREAVTGGDVVAVRDMLAWEFFMVV